MLGALRISWGPLATTRRKPWRRSRARGSSGWAPRLVWAQPVLRWSPVEEAPATSAEVQAVESLMAEPPVGTRAVGTRAAATRAAATTVVETQVAGAPMVAHRNRLAAMQGRAERLSRASQRSHLGVPSSSKIRGILLYWST